MRAVSTLHIRLTIACTLGLFIFGAGACTSSGSNDDNDETQATATPESLEEISNLVINDFLWKPNSERDGNLVVLVNPVGVRVDVTGDISETLIDFGPSNGRGTTARSFNRGCNYGTNVLVEFFDSLGRRILVADGRREVRIPNGCDRLEFRL